MIGSHLFLSPGDSPTKVALVLLHLGLEGITEVDTDQKGGFVSFKITHRVYATSGYSTREHLARGSFFKGLRNYIKSKNDGNESKIALGDFNCTMVKWTGMVEIKHKDFIDAVPIMPILWVMA